MGCFFNAAMYLVLILKVNLLYVVKNVGAPYRVANLFEVHIVEMNLYKVGNPSGNFDNFR